MTACCGVWSGRWLAFRLGQGFANPVTDFRASPAEHCDKDLQGANGGFDKL